MSDNGSCPYDSNKDFSIPPGGPDSYRSLCAAWANAGDTPYRFYKQYGHEGGSHTHFIAHWPKTIQPGLCHAPAHLVDIYPTLLDLSGAKYPNTTEGNNTPSLDGDSLLPLFKGKERKEPEIIVCIHIKTCPLGMELNKGDPCPLALPSVNDKTVFAVTRRYNFGRASPQGIRPPADRRGGNHATIS